MSNQTLWYTRCPVPTAWSLAVHLGWLDEEFADDGITVNCVAPGPIDSAMTVNLPDSIRTLLPVGRLGRGDEVADAVTYLAGEQASFTTGEILDVNGGAFVG